MNSRYLGAAFATLFALACGRGPELIDRTQPNYIKKNDLLAGTWYYQETIVDSPPHATTGIVGYTSSLFGLEKIRFEIQENYLVAFRTYEQVPGLDPQVDPAKSRIGKTVSRDGRPYRGAPIAAWPISSHFDRQRQYNSATGEQSNILEENGSDRPWYEREFIRVNWAQNVISNLASMTNPGGVLAPNGNQALQVYVTPIDQNTGDDAFVTDYTETNGKKELSYFDFTIRAYVNPPKLYYPGYGAIPYCWLNPKVECEATEVKLRTSVLKIDEPHVLDYEPLSYDNRAAKKFGYYRTERLTYDRHQGSTESGRLLFANRHNIWAQAHARADGSRCDPAEEGCRTIPVQDRPVKPIVYWVESNYPRELWSAMEETEKGWDHAFRRAVAVPRGIEVKDTPQMFYICQTPVPKGAPAVCGKEGFVARRGDLRYSQITWIAEPLLSTGLLGLGPSAADPETGEIIQGVANLYGANTRIFTGWTQQILDLLNGDLSVEELIAGKDAKSYVFDHLNPTDPRRPPSGPWSSSQGLVSDPQRAAASFLAPKGNLRAMVDAHKRLGKLPVAKEDRRKTVDALLAKSPGLEWELISAPEVRQMVLSRVPNAGFRTRLENDPALYRQVARQTILRAGELDELSSKRDLWAGSGFKNGCFYLAEFADDAMMGLAKEMKKVLIAKIGELKATGMTDAQAKAEARDHVWKLIDLAVVRHLAEHELGHTFGLYHNFAGSYDAMNYQDGYWDLRKQTVGVLVGGKRVMPIMPQNLLDASKQNQAQIDGRMRDLQYSSTMEYGARITSQVKGLGKYDDAAILFAYAGGPELGFVEVFNETRARGSGDANAYESPNSVLPTDNQAKQLVVRGAHVEVPLAQVEHWTPVSQLYSDKFHYTTLPFHFADKNLAFDEALEQGIKRMNNRSFRKWSEMEAAYKKIEDELHLWERNYSSFQSPNWEKAKDIVGKVARGVPVEVPYMFCSDYEVGANLACNRGDEGADIFEITTDWINRYKEYYPFNAFRRDRLTCGSGCFGPESYWANIDGRYLGNLPNVYQQWLFNIYWIQFYYNLTTEQLEEFGIGGDPIYQNYWTMAVIDSTNTLMQNLATPSTGYHGKTATGSWVHVPQNSLNNARLPAQQELALIQSLKAPNGPYTDVVYVPRGPGRSMYTLYDPDGLEFQGRVDEVGHFWDQVTSIFALTTSQTNFLGVDRGSDALRYSLPYFMTFNRELTNVFSNVWLDERARYGSSLTKTGNNLATVTPRTFVRGEDYVSGFVYPPPAPVPVDSNGQPLPQELIEASPTWSSRFYTQFFGMAYFTDNFNQEFASFNQIYRLGSGESLTPAPGYEVVTFASGAYQFAALKKVNDPNLTAAVNILEKAKLYEQNAALAKAAQSGLYQGLNETAWRARVAEAVRSMEMMRGLYGVFGTAM